MQRRKPQRILVTKSLVKGFKEQSKVLFT